MRFMYLVSSAQSAQPTAELGAAMQRLAEREIKAGRLKDMGGLLPLSSGARVQVHGGKLAVLDGPFAEAKEVVGGYALFELPDLKEAIAMAVEFMQLHQQHLPDWNGTCEVRPFAPS